MAHKISALLLFFSLSAITQPVLAAPPMTAEQTGEGILVSENGNPVLFYQKTPKSINGLYERSNYIHPLYNLNGVVITEDFPEDHLHQRGIFWTWHQILAGGKRLGDGWECRDIKWDVLSAEAAAEEAGPLVLKTRVHWKSPNWINEKGEMLAFVEEQAFITIYPVQPAGRKIDFEIRLLALEEDISIGGSEDEKGYGGFSPRIFLPEDVSFRGISGQVNPETAAVPAGQAIDITGTYGDKGVDGITIIQHPSNPGYPQDWILRGKSSMQNPVYPGRNPVKISSSQHTILKYRLVLHGSDRQDLEALSREYSVSE
jgi:Family of unknown function (DUF6807)